MSANHMRSNRHACTRSDQSCMNRRFHSYNGRQIINPGLDRANSPIAPHPQHLQNHAGSPVSSRLHNNLLNGLTNDDPTSSQRVVRCPYGPRNHLHSMRMHPRNNCHSPYMGMHNYSLPQIGRRDYFYPHRTLPTPPLPRSVHVPRGRAIYRAPSNLARRSTEIARETVPTIEMSHVSNKTSAQGTRSFPFQTTPGEDDDALHSITAMRVYRDKSFDELRLEDYRRGTKGKMIAINAIEEKKSTEDADEEKQNESRCVVCLENRKNVLILPCSHMCICTGCSDNKSLDKCPICRSTIEGKLIVYW